MHRRKAFKIRYAAPRHRMARYQHLCCPSQWKAFSFSRGQCGNELSDYMSCLEGSWSKNNPSRSYNEFCNRMDAFTLNVTITLISYWLFLIILSSVKDFLKSKWKCSCHFLRQGWGCSSVVEFLPSMCGTLSIRIWTTTDYNVVLLRVLANGI